MVRTTGKVKKMEQERFASKMTECSQVDTSIKSSGMQKLEHTDLRLGS